MPTHRRLAFLPALVALVTTTWACQSQQPASTAAPATTVATASPDVWAIVDGREIRREEVEKTYRRTVQPEQSPSNEETLAAKLNLLDQVIIEDILLAKARELKVEVPESELNTAFDSLKKGVPDDAFNKELAARNLTATDMRDGLRRDLIVQKVIEQEVGSKITVTDQDVTSFFEANKAQFNLPEDAYRVSQIVVTAVKDAQITNRSGDDAATPDAAAAKVQMLMDRLKGGTAFSELALDYSEDPQSAPRGGDAGLVPASALKQAPPPLRDAILKAQPGKATVVDLNGAYAIISVLGKEAAGQRDLSMPDVKESITTRVRGQREQLLRAAYVSAAREKAAVANLLARRLVESQGKIPALGLAGPK